MVRSGLFRAVVRGRRLRALVLLYHNVVPDDYPVRGEEALHLKLSDFQAQLDWISAEFRVLPLDRLDPMSNGEHPTLSITFDDAYRGALELAIPELLARNLPCTIFVAPGILGSSGVWWDVFSRHLHSPGDFGTFRDLALTRSSGVHDLVEKEATRLGLEPGSLGRFEGIASLEILRACADHPLVSLAAHSWSHPNLAACRSQRLAAELDRPGPWLRKHGLTMRPWIAYPYGLSSPSVREAAVRRGYVWGFAASGGWIRAGDPVDRLCLPRLSIPRGLSLNGFKLRLAGFRGRS